MENIKLMMIVGFVFALLFSLWKVYSFVPKKPLEDDDKTPEATRKLTEVMVTCIVESFESGIELTESLLFERMKTHETFDKEHFWRFNQNRLNQLLRLYYVTNPSASTLRDIYDNEKGAA